jgi:hypothetical protein
MKVKKIYKIRDKVTGQYVSRGYTPKSTWLTFPKDAIQSGLREGVLDKTRHVVDVFEMINTKSLDLDGKERQ